jgi:hypothetical protein
MKFNDASELRQNVRGGMIVIQPAPQRKLGAPFKPYF